MGTFSELTGGRFDVAIVGGGIIGAGIARDLALRGVSVALVEKSDFGSGTTSGSTRLIHGGLRYLEMLDFSLVRMDMREREILLRIAPHLVRPMEFRIPYVHTSLFFRQKLRAGLMLYDLLSYDRSLPGHRFLSAAETHSDEPSLTTDGLQGAASYFDAQVSLPERLCLENLLDAERHGAVIQNYCEVMAAEGNRLRLRDIESGSEGELHAKIIVNATGAWFDRVEQRLSGHSSARIRTTKGIHLTCGPLVQKANVLFSPVDGRLFFILPLLGKTWIGTTDSDFQGDPTDVQAEEADIEYLLRSVEPFFPDVRSLPIYSTNAGVRALVRQSGSESSVSRMHKVEETRPGVISVLGGKITGYRAIAAEAADMACASLRHRTACRTAQEPLPGGGFAGGAPEALAALYGSRAGAVMALAESEPSLGVLGAQVLLAVREEHCQHLDDFLLRRTSLAFSEDLGAAAALGVLRLLARERGWDDGRQRSEWDRFRTVAQRLHAAGAVSPLANPPSTTRTETFPLSD